MKNKIKLIYNKTYIYNTEDTRHPFMYFNAQIIQNQNKLYILTMNRFWIPSNEKYSTPYELTDFYVHTDINKIDDHLNSVLSANRNEYYGEPIELTNPK